MLKATLGQVRLDAALAVAGYVSEPNHQYARDERGVRLFMPATIGRPTSRPPTGQHRPRMKQRLKKHYGRYGQPWQVACTNAMIKRRLSTTVAAHRYWAQCRELLLIVLTFQCMQALDRYEPRPTGSGARRAKNQRFLQKLHGETRADS